MNNNFKKFRKDKLKLTQKEIEKITKIPFSTIGRVERQEINPTISMLIEYNKNFGVSCDYLLGLKENEH